MLLMVFPTIFFLLSIILFLFYLGSILCSSHNGTKRILVNDKTLIWPNPSCSNSLRFETKRFVSTCPKSGTHGHLNESFPDWNMRANTDRGHHGSPKNKTTSAAVANTECNLGLQFCTALKLSPGHLWDSQPLTKPLTYDNPFQSHNKASEADGEMGWKRLNICLLWLAGQGQKAHLISESLGAGVMVNLYVAPLRAERSCVDMVLSLLLHLTQWDRCIFCLQSTLLMYMSWTRDSIKNSRMTGIPRMTGTWKGASGKRMGASHKHFSLEVSANRIIVMKVCFSHNIHICVCARVCVLHTKAQDGWI